VSSVDIACRGMLVMVFLASAAGKARNFGGFVAAVRQLRLVPGSWPRPVARVVVAAEVVAAGLLLLPAPAALAGFGLVVVLAGVFAFVIEVSVRRGIRVPCPCFGAASDLLNRRQLVRNALLVVVAAVGSAGLDTGRLELVEVMVSLAVAVFLAAVVIRFDDVAELLVPRTAARP
jgi:hypothetical protein